MHFLGISRGSFVSGFAAESDRTAWGNDAISLIAVSAKLLLQLAPNL
jgi:hypothetical protein